MHDRPGSGGSTPEFPRDQLQGLTVFLPLGLVGSCGQSFLKKIGNKVPVLGAELFLNELRGESLHARFGVEALITQTGDTHEEEHRHSIVAGMHTMAQQRRISKRGLDAINLPSVRDKLKADLKLRPVYRSDKRALSASHNWVLQLVEALQSAADAARLDHTLEIPLGLLPKLAEVEDHFITLLTSPKGQTRHDRPSPATMQWIADGLDPHTKEVTKAAREGKEHSRGGEPASRGSR
jgi:hypothetical protein